MEKYQALFEPLTIKRLTLKNRVIMPPMGTNFANQDGTFNEQHYSYYEQRAKGGTGLITLENICIDYPLGTNGTTQLRMDKDQFIPGLWQFNERMHAYGAATSVQINHAGASAYQHVCKEYKRFLLQIFLAKLEILFHGHLKKLRSNKSYKIMLQELYVHKKPDLIVLRFMQAILI